jgi:hypothetical protein
MRFIDASLNSLLELFEKGFPSVVGCGGRIDVVDVHQ